jgi:quercetin dioxygenase-like cupin family protein
LKILNLKKMKTIKMILMPLLFELFLLQSTSFYAQDPMKAAPAAYKKILLENDQVRLMQVVISPGAIVPWHSHPNHVIYSSTSGKIEITEKGKKPTTVAIKAGTAMYIPAVTHMGKNTGTTTLRLVVTELKPMIAKKMAPTIMAPTKKK